MNSHRHPLRISTSIRALIRTTTAFTVFTIVLSYTCIVHADTFGSGANTFEIEFVPIGNPNNPDDTTGSPSPVGKVEYAYRMGKYKISEDMINKANTLGGLGITPSNFGANKPATEITWFEAAKFVNWLNTSKGYTPAYKFDSDGGFQLWQPGDVGYNPANMFRNRRAVHFLPSADEWYKAAYYDPSAGVYYDFPTGSNSIPDGIDFPGDTTFDAVFDDGQGNDYPNDITDVGVLSPYGTAGQGGNVREMEETEYDLVNDSISSDRGYRGTLWFMSDNFLRSSFRGDVPPWARNYIGFRVASISEPIPEPSSSVLALLALAPLAVQRRRRNCLNQR